MQTRQKLVYWPQPVLKSQFCAFFRVKADFLLKTKNDSDMQPGVFFACIQQWSWVNQIGANFVTSEPKFILLGGRLYFFVLHRRRV
jgi:hypothetical protein